jgi:Fe-S cluster assembly scaffold protein SufB
LNDDGGCGQGAGAPVAHLVPGNGHISLALACLVAALWPGAVAGFFFTPGWSDLTHVSGCRSDDVSEGAELRSRQVFVLFANRFASLVVCVALVCGASPAAVRGDLRASGGPEALTCERTASVPAELRSGRLSPGLLASAPQLRSHEIHPAVAAAFRGRAADRRWTHIARPSANAATCIAVHAHAERGPPHYVLS